MTTPERELLETFLEGYLKPAIDKIDGRLERLEKRTASLETTRAEEIAVRDDRRRRDEHNQSEYRWKIATAFSGGGLLMSFLYYTHILGALIH